MGGHNLFIEEFKDIKIAYIRRTGKYGAGNKQLMEKLKNYLKNNDLFKDDTTVLGIALDNPLSTPENEQRYDVGMVITGKDIHCDLPINDTFLIFNYVMIVFFLRSIIYIYPR